MSGQIQIFVAVSQLVCFHVSHTVAETPEISPPPLVETPKDKQAILEKEKIVPKVLAIQPKHVLMGDFEGKEMSFGNTYTPDEIKKKPTYLDWPTNGTRALYCLFAIGMDVPNKKKPKLADFRHWMVGNIPGTEIEKGQEIFPYIGAGNFYDEGSHRIIFVVFQQPGKRKIHFYERKLKNKRPIYLARGNTSTVKTAEKYSFREPVAANFITVDTGVPQSTTDYYAHTSEVVPDDWQGISLDPRMFGLTFDMPEDWKEVNAWTDEP